MRVARRRCGFGHTQNGASLRRSLNACKSAVRSSEPGLLLGLELSPAGETQNWPRGRIRSLSRLSRVHKEDLEQGTGQQSVVNLWVELSPSKLFKLFPHGCFA